MSLNMFYVYAFRFNNTGTDIQRGWIKWLRKLSVLMLNGLYKNCLRQSMEMGNLLQIHCSGSKLYFKEIRLVGGEKYIPNLLFMIKVILLGNEAIQDVLL